MTDRPTILLAPANPMMSAALRQFHVTGDPAAAAAGGPLWAFVDWLLPGNSGLEFCRRLRADPATAHAWIVIVLDDDHRELRRRALQAGADDYIVGPLTAEEVVRRIRDAGPLAATGRRTLTHGPISISREAFQIRAGGKPVPLAPNEFHLLAHFLENRDRVLTRRELIRVVKRGKESIDERTVDVWIGRLRRGIRAAGIELPIRTVRQLGYVFDS